MTTFGQSPPTSSPIRVGGLPIASAKITTGTVKRSFWASARRWMASPHRDIMEVSFGSQRLVNHLALKISRFPLVMQVEYLDANGDWQALEYASSGVVRKGPNRRVAHNPIIITFADSQPKRVDSARATAHPQHFGNAHWAPRRWKTKPVKTSKMRFIFTRNHLGTPPVDPRGNRVPYSVGIKDLVIGYKVDGAEDLPTTQTTDWWASSEDILGSRIVYSTYTQSAEAVVDGSLDTYWRSEPQPFPFAVVNLYLDVRDDAGNVPVVDRFWMDPVTTGPVCNVYYATEIPDGDFDGSSEPIPASRQTAYGTPNLILDPATSTPLEIDLGPDEQTGVEISNVYERLHYDYPWWVGIDATALAPASDTANRPLISLGAVQVTQNNGVLEMVAPNGWTASIPLDPALHLTNSPFRVVAAYYPYDPASQTASRLHLTYGKPGYDPTTVEIAIPDLDDIAAPVRIGLAPDPTDPSVSAMGVTGLVLKSESLSPDTEQWFLDEGADYVADPVIASEDRGTAQNARLRMHPMFVTPDNPFGLVGGDGNRFGEMAWTPVMRDYSLKRGYLHVPPTKAAYWKFEMTRLLPQVYENAVTISRDVLVFPPEVVNAYQSVTGQTSSSTPSGVDTIGNTQSDLSYGDMLTAVRQAAASPDATSVLVISDPRLASKAASTGWIWTYQPWHVGSSAPKFLGTQVHRYESIRVDHSTKVAFFAGLRELEPYRVDYTFADDTPEYVEHLLDENFIGSMTGVERYDGGVRSLGASGEVVSAPLSSYRTVRGVQFATQETDAYQVLDDPGFESANLSRWGEYGDATLTRIGPGDVEVNRGYVAYTNATWEGHTYAEMEAYTYTQLEGLAPTGYAEGGLTSQVISPTGAGRVIAVAEVSAASLLGAPVRLEIISVATGQVAAFDEKFLQQGEKATLECTYTSGTLLSRRTWGDVEHLDYVISVEQEAPITDAPETYAELENYTYAQIESGQVQSDLYARVRQQGATRDEFHVHRVGLYDSPIAWFFSNDGGLSWWQAVDVRNDPHAVLLFPPPPDPANVTPAQGRTLMWKVQTYREGATVNALHIRPWYGDRSRTIEGAHTMEALGPNTSIYDNMPATDQHPMWQLTENWIEHPFSEPVVIPFWRNLAITPGGEGSSTDGFSTSGGTVDVQVPGWTIMVPQPIEPLGDGGGA